MHRTEGKKTTWKTERQKLKDEIKGKRKRRKEGKKERGKWERCGQGWIRRNRKEVRAVFYSIVGGSGECVL